jgi:hypothetical protein
MSQLNPFQETIKSYLEKRAEEDSFFAITYKKENKSIEECCNYVIKCAEQGGLKGYTDQQVFGWAVHYYDEDTIKNIKEIKCRVVVNKEVELTEEEKSELRIKAIEIATREKSEEIKKDLIVNIELSAEEIEEAKKKAIDRVFEEQKAKMVEKKKSNLELAKKKQYTIGTLIPDEVKKVEKNVKQIEPVVNSNGQISFF